MESIEMQFDAYIKKTIKHTVINYAHYEIKKKDKEKYIEDIGDKENYSLSFFDEIKVKKIEECASNKKLAKILKELNEKQKKILTLSIIELYNSKEIGRIMQLSDSRVRHIINDTLKEIRKKLEE